MIAQNKVNTLTKQTMITLNTPSNCYQKADVKRIIKVVPPEKDVRY